MEEFVCNFIKTIFVFVLKNTEARTVRVSLGKHNTRFNFHEQNFTFLTCGHIVEQLTSMRSFAR